MKEINTVNQKSLPERTADAIVAMLHMEHGDDCVRGTLRERFLIYGIYFFHIELPFS